MNRNMLLSPSISNLVLHEIIVISPNLYRLLPLLPLPQVKRSMHPKKTLASTILTSTNGAFCTPRMVTRSLTCKRKPSTQTIIDEMKALESQGVGKFKTCLNNKVYYKPLPIDENKELIGKHGILMEDFRDVFCNKSMKDITPSQYNRLLSVSPNEQTLRDEYGYQDM